MSIDETAMVLSGQMVRNEAGIFYFDQPGNWVDEDDWPEQGHLHRLDGPAVIFASGDQFWYFNGKLHREDGPAIIFVSGNKSWYLNGLLHREDGPALMLADGTQEWYVNGVRTK